MKKAVYLALDGLVSNISSNKVGYATSEDYIKNLSDEEFERLIKDQSRHIRRASISIRRRKCTRL